MSSWFLNMTAFWWLALVPLVVLLYFLKLKREEHLFPSTILWQRAIEDLRVNSPFQRLRNNFLLFLQILLLLLAIIALARPFLASRCTSSKHVVLLIDNSASMQAIDEDGGSRLAKAKELARRIIDDLAEDDRLMLVSFAGSTSIRQPFTSLKRLLKKKLDELAADDSDTGLQEAMAIAGAMIQKLSSPSIYVITDGAIPELDRIAAEFSQVQKQRVGSRPQPLPQPKFLLVGRQAGNVAILALEVRADLQQNYQAFVRLQNFGDQQARGLLQLAINGEPLREDVRMVDLGPGDVNGILFKGIAVTDGVISAQFTITQGQDFLKVDNKAYFSLVTPPPPRLCLVTDGNYFLGKVLASHDSNLVIVAPVEFNRRLEDPAAGAFPKYDMVVFDGCSPNKTLPPGGYLFINSLPPLADIHGGNEIKASADQPITVIDQNELHPVMRFVDMRSLSLARALPVRWPEDNTPLLEIKNHTVMGCIVRNNTSYLVIGFDIFQSDWPLRISFPIFIANTIDWLVKSHYRHNVRVGESFHVRPPDKETSGHIVTPNGQKIVIQASPLHNIVYTQTDKAGLYTVEFPKSPATVIAVNLFSQEESEIKPRKQLEIDGKALGTRQLQLINREIWPYLLLAVFLVLMLEWYLFHRRSLIFWRGKLQDLPG